MKIDFKGLGSVLKKTFKGWNEDDPFRQSAVIAYYAIFSLPALLILVINVAGFFFGKEVVTGEISGQVEGIMGSETADQVGDIIEKASETKAGVISTIIAILTITFGATGVFVQLQKSLNTIWDVKQKPNKGFMMMLKSRLFSFGLVVSIGFLLLMSLVISSMLAALSNWLESVFSEVVAYLVYALEFAVSLAVISALFALMFKVLPDVKIKWRYVIAGSFLTGVLFLIGKYGLSFYFGKAEPASAYGAAGSVVLILLWSSYSSMIVFFGAEFTKQYAVFYGHKILPNENAEPIKETEVVNGELKHRDATTKEDNDLLPVKYLSASNGEQKKHKASWNQLKRVMKNKKEVQQEIEKLEMKLKKDKQDIKDDLKLGHLLLGLLPSTFKVENKDDKPIDVDVYLRNIAKHHITRADDTSKGWVDKILETLHLKKDGH